MLYSITHFSYNARVKERSNRTEIEPQAITDYVKTFVNRRDLYPIQLPNGTYVSVKKDLTDSMIYAHLKGHITIGAYALDPHGWSKWICFDADQDEHYQGLVGM